MNRVIVLGGLGSFGARAVSELRELGVEALTASRRPARGPCGGDGPDVSVDAEDAASIRRGLQPGDVVVDAAGPFQARSTTLIEAAIDVGFDVVDLNDALGYAERVLALEERDGRISAGGVRVLTSASSVSAISAAIVSISGFRQPVRADAFLAPASRHTANRASALSLVRSVGVPVRVWRDGALVTRPGWSEPRWFGMPQDGPIALRRGLTGRLFESADSIHLPRAWPSLRDVAMYVDTNTVGLNGLMVVAARVPALKRLLERSIDLGTRLSRAIGRDAGGLGYDIVDASGERRRFALVSDDPRKAPVIPVAPAVLAAMAIAGGDFHAPAGIVPPGRQVEPHELVGFLRRRAAAAILPLD